MPTLHQRIDRLRAAMPPRNPWGGTDERAALSEAIAAHCAGQELPARALQTLAMSAADFSDLVARVEASC